MARYFVTYYQCAVRSMFNGNKIHHQQWKYWCGTSLIVDVHEAKLKYTKFFYLSCFTIDNFEFSINPFKASAVFHIETSH